MELFGWSIKRKKEEVINDLPSFAPRENDDGAVVIAAGGAFGTYVDLDGTVRTEAELVTKYREMALQPECDAAVDEIVNESITIDENKIVELNLDKVAVSATIKKAIRDEFENCLRLLDFNKYAYDIFRRWYIDGRLYYHVVIDEKNPNEGIKELRYIDPRKIRKVRELSRKRITPGSPATEASLSKVVNEYFIFNDKGFNYGNKVVGPSTTGLKIAKDSILHVVSGLTDNQGTMVLSYLHKAIKALNQLRTLEDALVIYRLARAPERRIWYIDVGNLPKMKAEQYVREIMVKHKNRLIYDAESGSIRDDRKFLCFALDTKIPLLDGRTLELQELIKEHEEGKKNWVYSCDPTTGKFIPGPVSWAGITKRNSEVVKVTFDNGKSVVCTPDHKFPVWGKGFIEAKDILGESIIPGYRDNQSIVPGGNTYERIYQNDTQKWEFTHRVVSKWKEEIGIKENLVFDDRYYGAKKTAIHHLDFNRYNNSPDNLVMMNYIDHKYLHLSHNTILYTEELIEKIKILISEKYNGSQILELINKEKDVIDTWAKLNSLNPKRKIKFTHKDLVRVVNKLGYDSWRQAYQQNNKIIINNEEFLTYGKAIENFGLHEIRKLKNPNISKKWSDEHKQKISKKRAGNVQHCKSWKIYTPNNEEIITENLNEFCRKIGLNRTNIKGKYGSKGYKAEILRNHIAVSVEWLEEKIDVGCITVDLEETYHSHHTYLLDAGVYTKNTMLEDYWLPRREGGRGTEVTTLPGGQTLGQMDDVLYFQKKFLQTLNVPISRLNSDALFSIGRATEITRDELKFGKFVIRLRHRFSHLFLKMLEKQLVLKNIMTIEDWNSIAYDVEFDYSKDNYFTELKNNEIAEARLNLARNFQDIAGKYVSHDWVRRNILQQSQDDVDAMEIQISAEIQSQDPRWINPLVEQNIQLAQQVQQQTQAQQDQQDQQAQQDQGGEDQEKLEAIRKAMDVIKIQKEKGSPKNRSIQDQAAYKSAVQLVAKNPDIARKLSSMPMK